MATRVWKGEVAAVAQVDTITVAGAWAAADTATITINGKDLELTVGTDTATTEVATAIEEMINGTAQTGTGDHVFGETGNDVPEFQDITAVAAASVVSCTADVPGTPFTMTVTEVTAGNGTATEATATNNQSPNDWSAAGNWSGATVPVDADDVVVENSSVSILHGLDQSAVSLNTLTIKPTFTGNIGLPRNNAAGYVEYFDTYLITSAVGDATTCTYNIDAGGSGRIKLDTNDGESEINVYGSGTRAEADVPVILLKGTHAANVLNINKGDVGMAFFGGEAATAATIQVGYRSSVASDVDLFVGAGATTTTLVQTGGQVEILSAITTVTVTAGELTIGDDATVTTLNLDGGTCYYESDGTCGTANVAGGAVLDFRRDVRARTVSAANLYSGGAIHDPAETVTWTAGIDLQRCGLADVTLDWGIHRTATPTAI